MARSPLNSNEPVPVAVVVNGGTSCPPFNDAVRCICAGAIAGSSGRAKAMRERREVRFNPVL